MNKILILVLIYLFSGNTLAIGNLVLDPLPQSETNTCQSYSIAYSLAHSGLWHEEIQTPKQLRELERKIRLVIDTYVKEEKSLGNEITPYHHTTWVEAIKRVSSNNLKLTLYYPDTPNDYYKKISDITGFTSEGIVDTPVAAALIERPVMTSVMGLDGNRYEDGHIVTVLGLAVSQPENLSLARMNQDLVFLNSAIKSNGKTFNMCSDNITSGDKKYSAGVSVTADYELKDWSGKYLLMWVDKN